MTAPPSIHQLLAELRSKDVKLSLEDGRLRCNAPKGVLTLALQQRLSERKDELVAFLQLVRCNAAGLPPIRPVARGSQMPVSYAQEGAWFIDQLQPGIAFNIPLPIRVRGKVDEALLQQALDRVVERHEALRTSFASVEGQPYQCVADKRVTPVSVVELSSLPTGRREAELLTQSIDIASRPFDLSHGPLLRMTLFRLGSDDQVLLLTAHHIVFDGHSVGVFARDFAVFYEEARSGKRLPLPKLTVQYADYAAWQRQVLSGEFLEAQLNYWGEKLANYPTGLNLITDRRRTGAELFHGGTLAATIPKQTSTALRTLAQREGVTMFMLLLAAFKSLLTRYTGQDDIIVGTPIANRSQEEMANVIGFCVNMLALRSDLSGNPPFRELLQRVRETCLGAYSHQELPFGLLVQHMRPDRYVSHSPFFSVGFALRQRTTNTSDVELGGIQFSSMYDLVAQAIDDEMEKHRGEITPATDLLYLDMVDTGEEITAVMQHSSDMFSTATIERMMRHFEQLLEGVVADSDARLFDIPLLAETERRQMLVEWNSSECSFASGATLHELFEAQVERDPKAIAIVVPVNAGLETSDQRLTYDELNRRANQLARYLRRQGVGPEIRVAICLERSPDLLVAVYGVLKAGAAYVPLDSAQGAERLRYMLSDSNAALVLTQAGLLGDVDVDVRVIDLQQALESVSQELDTNPCFSVDDRQLAYVMYTSGSTGRPKGVMVSHRSLVNAYQAWETAYELKSLSSHLQMATFSFDVFAGDMTRALSSGAALVLCPRESLLMGDELHSLFERYQIDCAEFVPAVMRGLVDYLRQSHKRLDWLKLMLVGSDSWSVSEYKEIQQLVGPQVRVINSYGVAEATIDSTYYERESDELTSDSLVPIGRPFRNSQAYILDAYLNPVPMGVAGELYIGGAGLARGYCDRPDLTAERFVPDSLTSTPGARLYRTGDRVRYLSDGNIEFLGRVDHQVKIRGFRIEPGEIESVLGEHPGVAGAIVLVHSEASGEKRLVGYVSYRGDDKLDAAELRSYLSGKVPDYMVPSVFLILDKFPLTPSGKIDRRSLPDPAGVRADLGQDYVAPRTETEIQLSRIWNKVLDVERVGINDNFFLLGGHSLLAAKLVASVRADLQRDLPLRTLFERPTIGGLARYLDSECGKAAQRLLPPEVVAIQPQGSKPPLFLFHAVDGNVTIYMDFVQHFDHDQPIYGLQHPGLLDGEASELSLVELASRYLLVIQSVQPQGPYLLAGWSLGGVLAYEVARQLDEQGSNVGLVALIDARVWSEQNAEQDAVRSREQAEVQFGVSVESFLQLSPGEQLDFVLERAKTAAGTGDELSLLNHLASELGMPIDQLLFLLEESIPADHSDRWRDFLDQAQRHFGSIAADRRDELRRQLRVVRGLMAGLGQYRPQPYRGPLELICAGQSSDGEIARSWAPFAMGGMTVYTCPGHHFSIMRPPHVREAARRIKACLEESSRTSSAAESGTP